MSSHQGVQDVASGGEEALASALLTQAGSVAARKRKAGEWRRNWLRRWWTTSMGPRPLRRYGSDGTETGASSTCPSATSPRCRGFGPLLGRGPPGLIDGDPAADAASRQRPDRGRVGEIRRRSVRGQLRTRSRYRHEGESPPKWNVSTTRLIEPRKRHRRHGAGHVVTSRGPAPCHGSTTSQPRARCSSPASCSAGPAKQLLGVGQSCSRFGRRSGLLVRTPRAVGLISASASTRVNLPAA